jgi:hypothetical protein
MGNDHLLEARWQDQVRNHPIREKILALTEDRDDPPDPEWLCWVLPDNPALAVVEYHLSVLREAALLA